MHCFSANPDSPRIPKLCGADIELGNAILGEELQDRNGTGRTASRALLREVEGYPNGLADRMAAPQERDRPYSWLAPSSSNHAYSAYPSPATDDRPNAQDWGRKFLPSNGGCIYIDLDHLELCLPEVLSAYDHVACWHAMLRLAEEARRDANRTLGSGRRVQVLVNNSDGQGNSYGSHLDFLITRRAWDNLFDRKLQYLLFLAAYHVSSIVFTGQGKVGSENGAAPCEYQLSQRADFIETLTGSQTTYRRPLVNSRDEPLCGMGYGRNDPGRRLARLHCIFYDSTLCQVASLLKVGVMQMILAMIEAECVDLRLILDDPLDALARWSRDPSLSARVRLLDGAEVTAVDLQLRFLAAARRFARAGGFEGVVPHFGKLLALWREVLHQLRARDWTGLSRRVDWVLKASLIRRTLTRRPTLNWASPEIKVLDHLYASLDPDEGLFRLCERGGQVEAVVPEEAIDGFTREPPEDTRAWTRAMLLRRWGSELGSQVSWDLLEFRDRWYDPPRRLRLSDPLAFTRADAEPLLSTAATLDEVLAVLDPPESTWLGRLAPAHPKDTERRYPC